jgi:citrate lyase beta subunit
MRLRSLLFVPGSRPERFAKAAETGADAVCIDLEDAVALAVKSEARQAALAFLNASPRDCAFGVRINAISSLDGLRDIVALAEAGTRIAFVVIPKVACAGEVMQVRELLRGSQAAIWPLIETPEGLQELPAIAQAAGPNAALLFGGADFSACIGSDMTWDALAHVRGALVVAAARAGCHAIDVPYLSIADLAGLVEETRRVKSIGFSGRIAIHPGQVQPINEVFSPSPEEASRAARIVAAFHGARDGATVLDGKLVERAVVRAALRILDLAE